MTGLGSGPVIGFAGMTHLGLNSAAAAAERGFRTICFDPDAPGIEALRGGTVPVVEPQLSELLEKNSERLEFHADVSCLGKCDLVYIATDVPTDDQANSDLTEISKLIESVAAALSPQALLVVLCQVPPGFTRMIGFDKERLFYQVETLIFGRAIERALYPERIIVGTPAVGQPLPAAFAQYLSAFDCPVLPMRYESAELAKISINMCLVASVTTANMLAEICEGIGADWSEIVPALKLDRRIGEYAYLAPGLGLSGGNLERDLATVVRIGQAQGCDVATVEGWRHNSRYRRDWALRELYRLLAEGMAGPVIAVLGLAYKPDTDSIKNSPAISLVNALPHCAIRTYDPVVSYQPQRPGEYEQCDRALDACGNADAVVLMTPWPEFFDLDAGSLAESLRGDLVVDPYGVLDGERCRAAGLRHTRLGVGD